MLGTRCFTAAVVAGCRQLRAVPNINADGGWDWARGERTGGSYMVSSHEEGQLVVEEENDWEKERAEILALLSGLSRHDYFNIS